MVASGAADPRRRHGPKKGPANKAGPRGSSCVRVAVWVESPSPPHASPNRVCGIGSMVCSVAHTDCPVPKKMPGRIGGRGPAKSGDHSSPKEQPRAGLLTLGGKRKAEPGRVD